ncbi:sugar phosphate isomerase/epimerase [Methanorbis rubei]|uniref:Xylose isomerase-like TIM barrel domain-containing protein n=1 Tax=Methanorbis rubei TaxID=3028300 RepID=A0AAE4SD46_9EURY|nr:hypothetical protein [Methanocorpusculaceae archaeon Cs1]
MNRFGVSTNCRMADCLADVLEDFSLITNLVEIQCDANHSLFSHADICDSFDLRYTIHAPTGDGNIAIPFEPMRQASLEVLRETAVLGDRIGAEKLVIHPGFCLIDSDRPAAGDALSRSIIEIGKMQQDFSIKFVIENLGSWTCCYFQTPDLLEEIRSSGLGFALDVGHAHLTGTLFEFLDRQPDHFHLHDNHGTGDEHLACGTGSIDFSKVLPRIGSTTAIIEVAKMESVEKSLAYLNGLKK